jgi:hypothetical protein
MSPAPPTNPEYDEFAAAFGDASARGPIDYRRIEVVDPEMAAVYRAKTPAERLRSLLDANETMRQLLAARFAKLQPNLTRCEINTAVVLRMQNRD